MSSVDVVVPCYKYADYLRDCVTSVLSQEGVAVRVLIMDDCSPDHTPAVGGRLAAEDSRVEYRRHPVNLGHIATYNEGLLQWAEADYCLLLSADDMLLPGALGRAAGLMDVVPAMTFTYGKRIVIDQECTTPPTSPIARSAGSTVLEGADFVRRICETVDNPVCTPTAVVRTSAQRRVGGYRPELPHTGDMEMWLRLAAHGSVGVLEAPQAYWRRHGQNMRESYRGLSTIHQHKAAFDHFFLEDGRRIADFECLSRRANRQLSERAVQEAARCFDRSLLRECEELLLLAQDIDPSIVNWGRWQWLTWKRALGPALWFLIRPAADRIRSQYHRWSASLPIAEGQHNEVAADWQS